MPDTPKLLDLTGAKVLYDDLRDRVEEQGQSVAAKAPQSMVSDAWTQRTWTAGEYCIDNNKLWKCLVNNTQRPSEGANWTEKTLSEEFAPINISSDLVISNVSGNATLLSTKAVFKQGNVIQIVLNIKATAEIQVGSNILTATLSGVPLPKVFSTGMGYTGSTIAICQLKPDGTFISRAMSSKLPSNFDFIASLIYFC